LDLGGRVIIGDINEFDNEELVFSFDIPRNVDEGTYSLILTVLDEDDDIYENDFDDDESEYTVSLNVGSCLEISGSVASVSANLVSEAVAGKPLVVRTTITNSLSDAATFSLGAAGFTGWATSVDIDQTSLLLNAGQSADVLMTFEVSDDASGTQSFFVEVVSDGQVIRQPVSVSVEPKSLFGFTGGVIGGGSGTLWALGLLNIILVVVIILVAVKVARR